MAAVCGTLFRYTRRAVSKSSFRLLYTKLSPSYPTISLASSAAVCYRTFTLNAGLMKSTHDSEWKEKLTPEQYNVCRRKGTEPPWSGEYNDSKGKGTYQCVCCGADLFSSSTKFESGSGWPSFYAATEEESGKSSVVENVDSTYGMRRTEVVCKKCDSHLGHVFSDGPQPTGLRYCINSVALQFNSSSD